jgi:hypothetical protein
VPSLDQKTQNAIDASQALIDLLVRCGELHWPARIHRIRDALQDYELDRAVSVYESLPMGGMGGLLDLYLCKENGHTIRDVAADNKTLGAAIGALGKSIGNLRVYMQYEIDNPLVTVPDAA